MVRSARFERATTCLEGRCSIHLSYERISVTDWEQPCCVVPNCGAQYGDRSLRFKPRISKDNLSVADRTSRIVVESHE